MASIFDQIDAAAPASLNDAIDSAAPKSDGIHAAIDSAYNELADKVAAATPDLGKVPAGSSLTLDNLKRGLGVLFAKKSPWERYKESVDQGFASSLPEVKVYKAPEGEGAGNRALQVGAAVENTANSLGAGAVSPGAALAALNPLSILYSAPRFVAGGIEALGNVSKDKPLQENVENALGGTIGVLGGVLGGKAGLKSGIEAPGKMAQSIAEPKMPTKTPSLLPSIETASGQKNPLAANVAANDIALKPAEGVVSPVASGTADPNLPVLGEKPALPPPGPAQEIPAATLNDVVPGAKLPDQPAKPEALGPEAAKTHPESLAIVKDQLKNPDNIIQYSVWPGEFAENGKPSIPQIDFIDGKTKENTVSTNPKLLKELGKDVYDTADLPENIKPGAYTEAQLEQAIKDANEAKKEVVQNKAKPESATKTKSQLIDEIKKNNPNSDIEAPDQLLQSGKYEVRDVPIKDIGPVFGKETIQPDVVKNYQNKPSDKPIILAKFEGELRPVDGKHRLTAAINNGAETIKAWVPVEKVKVDKAAKSYLDELLATKEITKDEYKARIEELKRAKPSVQPSPITQPSILKSDAIQKQSPESVPVPPQAEAGKAVGEEVRGRGQEPAAARQEVQVTEPVPVSEPSGYRIAAQNAYRNQTVADISGAINRSLDSPSVDIGQKQAVRDLIDQHLPGFPDTIKDATKNKSVTELEDLRDRLASIEATGRDVVKERRAEVEQDITQKIDELKASKSEPLTKTEKINQIGVRLNPIDRAAIAASDTLTSIKNAWEAVDQHTANRDTVFNMMDGFSKFRGGMNRVFGGALDEAYAMEQNLKSDWKEPIQAVADSGAVKNKLGFGEISPKSMERINIYAHHMMDLANPDIPNTHLADSGITPERIAHVVKTITPKELEFYNAAREVLDNKSGPAVRDAMHKGFNIEVGQIKNYWPTQVIERANLMRKSLGEPIKGEAGAEASIRELVNGLRQDVTGRPTSKVNRGQALEKIEGAHGIINLSDNLIDRHLNQAAHLVSHAETVSNLARIARQDWFAEKYGDRGQKYVLNLLDSVARDSDPAGSRSIPIVNTITKNYAVAILGLRLFSQLKHVGNMAYALNEVGPAGVARGFIEANTPEGKAFLKKYAPEAYQRAGGETTIQELISGGRFKRFQAAMFAPERVADKQIAAITTLAAYKNELTARGISTKDYLNKPVDRKAMNQALITARKVVTSSLRKDSPQAISRGALTGGSMTLSRAAFQFQQTALRQIHYAKTELLDEGIKQGDYADAAKAAAAIIAAVAFETAMVHASRKATGSKQKPGEEASLPSEMAAEAVRKVPGVGNLMAASGYGETGVPSIDLTTKGLHSIGNVASGKNDFGGRLSGIQLEKAKIDAATFGGSLLGIPGATTLGQALKNSK